MRRHGCTGRLPRLRVTAPRAAPPHSHPSTPPPSPSPPPPPQSSRSSATPLRTPAPAAGCSTRNSFPHPCARPAERRRPKRAGCRTPSIQDPSRANTCRARCLGVFSSTPSLPLMASARRQVACPGSNASGLASCAKTARCSRLVNSSLKRSHPGRPNLPPHCPSD